MESNKQQAAIVKDLQHFKDRAALIHGFDDWTALMKAGIEGKFSIHQLVNICDIAAIDYGQSIRMEVKEDAKEMKRLKAVLDDNYPKGIPEQWKIREANTEKKSKLRDFLFLSGYDVESFNVYGILNWDYWVCEGMKIYRGSGSVGYENSKLPVLKIDKIGIPIINEIDKVE